jgi:hypothetical protein
MLSLNIFASFNFTQVSADSISTGMGFEVDTIQYGTCKDVDMVEGYTYMENMYGVLYAIGFSQIKTAVYEN